MNEQLYKADAGKLLPSLLFSGMPRALLMIVAVLTYGAQKYAAHSWKNVSPDRYEDALKRHMMALDAGETYDEETGLPHRAHIACNALFLLETDMKYYTWKVFKQRLRFKKPPQDHKNAG